MSLIVEVYVGSYSNRNRRKLVAEGVLHNVTDLADISDYEGAITEFGNKNLNIPVTMFKTRVTNHHRKQSVWKLVSKMINGIYGENLKNET